MNNITPDEGYLKYKKIHKDTAREQLEHVFSNLYYTWDKDLYHFVDSIDNYDWRKSQNPITIIHHYLETTNIAERDKDIEMMNKNCAKMEEYLHAPTWFDKNKVSDPLLAKLEENPIVYFSAEYGLVDWLQIYSGGLGVLAGDFLKQTSDHGLPLVAIGLFYHEGYFHQDIDSEGLQREVYFPQDPAACTLSLVKDENDDFIMIPVIIEDHDVYVRVWKLQVGRRLLYLLDTNFSINKKWEDRMITAHLYGGSHETRIRQELVLGIGGYRFIKKNRNTTWSYTFE